ncbi:unnamed protein product, partial [Pleuronectes platessa]
MKLVKDILMLTSLKLPISTMLLMRTSGAAVLHLSSFAALASSLLPPPLHRPLLPLLPLPSLDPSLVLLDGPEEEEMNLCSRQAGPAPPGSCARGRSAAADWGVELRTWTEAPRSGERREEQPPGSSRAEEGDPPPLLGKRPARHSCRRRFDSRGLLVDTLRCAVLPSLR